MNMIMNKKLKFKHELIENLLKTALVVVFLTLLYVIFFK